MTCGTVIVINGASSSGKSSIVKALQQIFDEPFLDAGLDRFLWMLPTRYLDRPLWDDVLGMATEAGQAGHRLVHGMHRAIAALSKSGIHVLADHVLVEEAWVTDLATAMADLPCWLVGVYCPLEVLDQRERERADRTLGQGRAQYEIVHQFTKYDLTVDTSLLSPAECALQIQAMVRRGFPTALKQIKRH